MQIPSPCTLNPQHFFFLNLMHSMLNWQLHSCYCISFIFNGKVYNCFKKHGKEGKKLKRQIMKVLKRAIV